MKNLIRTSVLLLIAGLLSFSCESPGYTATYFFGSRADITFSEVTASNTPSLRELAAMLSQKRSEIQKDFQFDWMVTGSGSSYEEAMKHAVDQAIAVISSSILYSFDIELQIIRNELDARKQEFSATLSQETGSVTFTVNLHLTGDSEVVEEYEIPLAVSASYKFECRGKNDTY